MKVRELIEILSKLDNPELELGGDPVAFSPVSKPESRVGEIVNELTTQQEEARQHILRNLMENPGFLSTYGDDFVAEWDPVDIETETDPVSRNLDQVEIRIVQKARFYTKEAYQKHIEEELKKDQLRQNPDGGLESV